jgi:diacylglycerol kinase (ATP)
MKKRNLIDSFNAAIEGIIYTIKTQRNMRLHFLFAIMIILFSIFLQLERTELLIVCFTVSLVLICEMFNTAIEKVIDLITSDFHPLARIIKDVAAGCVLIASILAVIVGYLVFAKYIINFDLERIFLRVRYSSWHATFASLLLVIFLVLMGKAFSKKGTPLRGGMPSGHSAIAFSIWTIIALVTRSSLVAFLSFIVAFLVAQSRVRHGIHNAWEVIIGALVGVLATLVCFQVFYQLFY